MTRTIFAALLACALAAGAGAQEPQSAEAEVPAAETGSEDAADAAADEIADDDELVIDAGESGSYNQNEDDEFVPTQEVSSDQSLKFPVDI